MQTTGNGVTAAAELTTGVEDRHDNLNRGLVLGGVFVDGNTAAVIDDANTAIG